LIEPDVSPFEIKELLRFVNDIYNINLATVYREPIEFSFETRLDVYIAVLGHRLYDALIKKETKDRVKNLALEAKTFAASGWNLPDTEALCMQALAMAFIVDSDGSVKEMVDMLQRFKNITTIGLNDSLYYAIIHTDLYGMADLKGEDLDKIPDTPVYKFIETKMKNVQEYQELVHTGVSTVLQSFTTHLSY